MTDVDENLLTAAKLGEQLRGEMDGGPDLLDHAGLVEDGRSRSVLSFLLEDDDLQETELVRDVLRHGATESASEALFGGNATVLSHLVGVTEQDLDGSSLRLSMKINAELENNGAPAFLLVAGNPNSGKTNTLIQLTEMRKAAVPELMVISNIRSLSMSDEVVTSAHDLAVTLLENRERPKAVLLDEGSTHFDARTYRREVATQWTPLAKRFAKVNVDLCGVVGHTGKDVHPEEKRLTTLGIWKLEKRVAEFFERWESDSDRPTDRLFGGPVESFEEALSVYDPDDAAPWSWDLEPELFARDLDWAGLREVLKERGPA